MYQDYLGREIEDLEGDNMQREYIQERNKEALTEETAETLRLSILKCMGVGYNASVNNIQTDETKKAGNYFVSLWTARTAETWELEIEPNNVSRNDEIVTTFSTFLQWKLFKQACETFVRVRNESILQYSKTLDR